MANTYQYDLSGLQWHLDGYLYVQKLSHLAEVVATPVPYETVERAEEKTIQPIEVSVELYIPAASLEAPASTQKDAVWNAKPDEPSFDGLSINADIPEPSDPEVIPDPDPSTPPDHDPSTPPTVPPTTPVVDVPLVDISDEEVPLVDIPDEEVPLADLPKTGDISVLWYIMTIVSGCALMVLCTCRKNEEET